MPRGRLTKEQTRFRDYLLAIGFKLCMPCGWILPLGCFAKDSCKPGGVRSECRVCQAKKAADYRNENPDKVREWEAKSRNENPDKVRECKANYRKNNPDKVRETQAKNRKKHREEFNRNGPAMEGTRRCGDCEEEFHITEFSVVRGNSKNRNHLCKACDAARAKRYENVTPFDLLRSQRVYARRRKAAGGFFLSGKPMPQTLEAYLDQRELGWPEIRAERKRGLAAIVEVYKSREGDDESDHEIAINGKVDGVHVVCGLHVARNLRVLSASDNRAKWDKHHSVIVGFLPDCEFEPGTEKLGRAWIANRVQLRAADKAMGISEAT